MNNPCFVLPGANPWTLSLICYLNRMTHYTLLAVSTRPFSIYFKIYIYYGAVIILDD